MEKRLIWERHGQRGGKRYSLRIYQKGSLRTLEYNNTIHSMLDREKRYVNAYYDYFLPLPLLFQKAKVLVIGLGGGSIPFLLKEMYGERVSVDVVEFDRLMVEGAKKFLPSGRLPFKVTIADGLSHIKRTKKKYDIVILDAFINDRIPYPFTRAEFINDTSRALSANGILAINYAPDLIYLQLYLHRLRKQFKTYKIRHVLFGNYILICSKKLDSAQIKGVIRSKLKEDAANRHVLKKYSKL
jgi:spermidine synthase